MVENGSILVSFMFYLSAKKWNKNTWFTRLKMGGPRPSQASPWLRPWPTRRACVVHMQLYTLYQSIFHNMGISSMLQLPPSSPIYLFRFLICICQGQPCCGVTACWGAHSVPSSWTKTSPDPVPLCFILQVGKVIIKHWTRAIYLLDGHENTAVRFVCVETCFGC